MLGSRRALLHMAIILVIGIACVVPFAGCGGGGGGGGDGGSANVSGRVLDDGTLNPVIGATVNAGGGQTTTGAGGLFTLTGVSTGTVSFTVNAGAYDQLVESRTLFSGANNAGDFFLKPTRLSSTRGHVGGTAQTLGGAPVGSASVTVLASSVNFGAKSKTDGSFTVYNVPFGPGSLSAFEQSAGTFGPAALTVDQAQESVGIIRLTTGPPPPPPFP